MDGRGRFITLEGGEGAGKSTQIRLLAEALQAGGRSVLTTREPGGSDGAEEIRALLVKGEVMRWDGMTEALLNYAARRDHVVKVIEPALAAGRWVISDRFFDSTTAYQGVGHGVDRPHLDALRRVAIDDFAPDLTLILDLPVADGLARAHGRGGDEDRYERMGRDFHERLRRAFLDIAAAEPERCAVIDAGAEVEAVQAAIMTEVETRLGRAGGLA